MGKFVGIAFKNVFRNGRRSITLGLNYAVVSFILVALFSFSRGATTNVSTSLVRATAGHITISGQYAQGGRVYSGMLRAPEIATAARAVLGPEALILPRYLVQSSVYFKGLSKRLSFTGIDPATDTGFRSQMNFTSGSWSDWAADPAGVALPTDTAAYFGLALGDEVVVSTRTRFGAFNTGILKVRAIWSTDNYFMKDLVLVHFPFLRNLDLAAPDSASAIYIYLKDPSAANRERELLSNVLAAKGFEVSRPKNDTEAIAAISGASLKYEADKEGRDRVMLKLSTIDEVLGIVKSIVLAVNALGGLVAAVMLFVIAVSVFINLRMSVNERLREIGTMRALGFGPGTVTSLFVLESVALALMFSVAGSVLGALASIGVRGLLTLPPGGNLAILMSSGHLALEPRLGDDAAIVAIIVLFSALFSYFPARRGGHIKPVDALTSTF